MARLLFKGLALCGSQLYMEDSFNSLRLSLFIFCADVDRGTKLLNEVPFCPGRKALASGHQFATLKFHPIIILSHTYVLC